MPNGLVMCSVILVRQMQRTTGVDNSSDKGYAGLYLEGGTTD
jgi:hypothetical protein